MAWGIGMGVSVNRLARWHAVSNFGLLEKMFFMHDVSFLVVINVHFARKTMFA